MRTLLPSSFAAMLCAVSAFAQEQPPRVRPMPDAAGFALDGPGYDAAITWQRFRFAPGDGATTQRLELTALSAQRGERSLVALPSGVEPERTGTLVTLAHAPGIDERFEARADGVEVSWRFATRPAGHGDLVVRYAVGGAIDAVGDDRGFDFTLPSGVRVHVGAVTGIDAAGVQYPGGLRFEGGVLEMSLPASCVDTASYPLLLDPVVGSAITIDQVGLTPQPDAAYDASLAVWAIAYRRQYAPGDIRARVSTLYSYGATNVLPLSSQGVAIRPQVANLGSGDRFGVVWTDATHNTTRLCFEAATTSNTYAFTVLSSGPNGSFASADIGAEIAAPIGSGRGFVVVYEDNQVGAIRARPIWFDTFNAVHVGGWSTLWQDNAFATYDEPSISRAAGPDGRLIVVARRSSLSGSTSIVGRVVSSDLGVLGPSQTVLADSGRSVRAADVDGYAGRGIVACEFSLSTLETGVWFVPVNVAADGQSLEVGTDRTIGGTAAFEAERPAVGYAVGKSWLCYMFEEPGGSPPWGMRWVGVDGTTCVDCGELISYSPQSMLQYLDATVATAASGGDVASDDALLVYRNGPLIAQRATATFNGGGIANLGGGCGNGGAPSFSANPSIGRNRFTCSLSGLPPTALLTIFNLAPLSSTVACGPCVWTPFSVTATPPLVAGGAEFAFPIPCQTALIGSALEVQWTTLDPAQTACPLLPGFVISDRSLLTFGQ